jgi:hypothetical protein
MLDAWRCSPRPCSRAIPTSHIHRGPSNLLKLLIYETILKPIWTYGIQLWGTASISNIEILERLQLRALLMIVVAPWYVPNTVIRRDLQTPINLPLQLWVQSSPQRTPKRPSSEPHGATRKRGIAKTPAKWSVYQIPSVIVVFVILVLKV